MWLLFALLFLLALIPPRLRNPVLGVFGRVAGRVGRNPRQRALANLQLCFPLWSEEKRDRVVGQMFATAVQVAVAITEMAFCRRRTLQRRIQLVSGTTIEDLRREGRRVILMVPHGWGVDIPAVALASYGLPVAAMFKPDSNPLLDWAWNRIRLRFGGRLHTRQQGIRPFIRSVRCGYLGYYLPDQDHGAEKSLFVDFFASYKATLPILGKIMRLTQAEVIPLFPVYDGRRGIFKVHLHPAMDEAIAADPLLVARWMNREIELLVDPHPEQYMWVLKLLKSRREGDEDPYR